MPPFRPHAIPPVALRMRAGSLVGRGAGVVEPSLADDPSRILAAILGHPAPLKTERPVMNDYVSVCDLQHISSLVSAAGVKMRGMRNGYR